MRQYINLGAKIYRSLEPGDYWRIVVFTIRSMARDKQMMGLINFLKKNTLKRAIAETHPYLFEQATRQWLYHNSTFIERLNIIKEHFLFCDTRMTEEGLRRIYLDKGLILWKQEYQDEFLSLSLQFHEGHKKEGLMAGVLKLGEKMIYQVIFWVGPDNNGKMALWIGALQGSRDGLQINRDLTKHFFGYRPKNLIVYAMRTVASQLGLRRIYAVSNQGFYTNNHLRLDRKLKTSLDDFWLETGGTISDDSRFFTLPNVESRKSLAEVSSQKRNLYRKRFATLDLMETEISQEIDLYKKIEK